MEKRVAQVAVLGAGIVGVTTAYQLASDGHDVVVIDRQPAVARECSFANGGYVAISQAIPWSAPGVPTKTLMTMLKPDAPILLHPTQIARMWRWGLEFMAASRASISWENTKRILELSLYSFAILNEVRAAESIEYRQRAGGTLKVFSDRKSLNDAIRSSEAQRPLGLNCRILDRQDCLDLVPALGPRIDTLAGGIHFTDEECGDCRAFAEALAAACTRRNVAFHFNSQIERLETEGNRIRRVVTTTGTIEAESYILATGAEAPRLVKDLGIRLPIIPVKGYSFTLPRGDWEDAPRLPVLDEMRKMGLMPLGDDQIRITGFAEIAGYDTTPREARQRAFVGSFIGLFPQLAALFSAASPTAFCCLRPVTPSGLPIIGRSRFRNLFYNVGHGHIGWTLGHGTARIVADIVAGTTPAIPVGAYAPTAMQ